MSDMSEASVFPVEPESGTPGRQYRLALRGNSLNPMIDAATPLLGMVMRLSTMNSQAMPEHLFAQVVTSVCPGSNRCPGRRATTPGTGIRTGRHCFVPLHSLHVY